MILLTLMPGNSIWGQGRDQNREYVSDKTTAGRMFNTILEAMSDGAIKKDVNLQAGYRALIESYGFLREDRLSEALESTRKAENELKVFEERFSLLRIGQDEKLMISEGINSFLVSILFIRAYLLKMQDMRKESLFLIDTVLNVEESDFKTEQLKAHIRDIQKKARPLFAQLSESL